MIAWERLPLASLLARERLGGHEPLEVMMVSQDLQQVSRTHKIVVLVVTGRDNSEILKITHGAVLLRQ
jgi:hypothetical protein